MMNKKFKPLIALPPTEGLSYAERIMLQKSEEMSKRIPIIVIPEEAGSMMDEIQKLADDKKVEVAIVGMGEGKRGIRNISLALAAMNLTFALSECFKSDNTLAINNEENCNEKENLFGFTNRELTGQDAVVYEEDTHNKIFKDKDYSKPKKEKVKNNRKTKKRKKAKNGR